jgi:hypothetical protein
MIMTAAIAPTPTSLGAAMTSPEPLCPRCQRAYCYGIPKDTLGNRICFACDAQDGWAAKKQQEAAELRSRLCAVEEAFRKLMEQRRNR